MAHLDPTSGEMVDDEDGEGAYTGGSVGDQAGAPSFAPPPPIPTSNPLAQPLAPPPDPASFVPQPSGAGMVTHRPVLSDADTANLQELTDNGAALDENADQRRELAGQAGNAKVDRAEEDAANAQAIADKKAEMAQRQEEERARHEERIAKLQADAEAAYEKHKNMGLKDPDADKSFGHRLAAALAIGLGQYSAAINHTSNAAAKIFEDARADHFAMQRANIEKAKDDAIRAGVNVQQAMADRDRSLALMHAQDIGKIDAFRAKFAADSARLGIPEARIAATATMKDLDRQALEAREKHLDMTEGHLEKTRIYERGLTPKEGRAGKGGGGAGGAGDAEAKVYQYLEEHPGDNAGASRLAATLKINPKRVDHIIGASAPKEGQAKKAEAGATMMRAISTVEKLKAPSEKDWLKWQKNQDDVKAAASSAEKGELASSMFRRGLQGVGLLAKTEYEGLDDNSKAYFENVKRILESVGREQSGAAIGRNEWDNFGGQYGLQAKGGLDAAREYARDRLTMSGVAGRQIQASGGLPAKTEPPAPGAKPQKSDKERAQALIDSPAFAGFSLLEKAKLRQAAKAAK